MTEQLTSAGPDVAARIQQWFVDEGFTPAPLGLDVDIIDSRIIDSLQFVSFLLFIEELRGRRVPADEVKVETFRTIRTICVRHFA
jgi:acyl carrier protein